MRQFSAEKGERKYQGKGGATGKTIGLRF
jgi:hypothetical protein